MTNRKAKHTASHFELCKRDVPECICLSCVHDNYGSGEIDCCLRHGNVCTEIDGTGVHGCEDYEAEEESLGF